MQFRFRLRNFINSPITQSSWPTKSGRCVVVDNYMSMPAYFRAGVLYRQRIEGQRFGQAVFNTASYFWPDQVRPLAGSSYDPFHNDEKVEQFLTVVLERVPNPE